VQTADVVVIGAGVIGSATALELARRGRKVVCVDAGPGVGAGSTSSSSAIIRFHYSTLDAVLTSWEAAAMWDDFASHLGHVDPDGMVRFVRTGCLVFDFPGSNRDTVLSMLADVGIDYEELSPADIKRRWPALDVGDFWPPRPIDDPTFADDAHGELAGYYTPQAGFIDDPMRAAGNFMHAAKRHGATVRLNSRVVEIRRARGRVLGVTLADGERIDAPVVVNVGGPASGVINRMAGVADEMRIGHRPLRQEVHVAECPPGFKLSDGTATLVTDVNVGTYFRPQLGDTLVAGGTEPECDPLEWLDDPEDFNEFPTVEHFERTMMRVARRIPELGVPHRPVGLAALYDASDDWVPIYDKSSLEGFFMACGTSGNQFKNAPLAGIFMAELVDAAARGIDHDTDPITWTGPRTGRPIHLAAFSRLREKTITSGTVLG
jgi:sarcosine oxidase, subunit beta